MVRVEDGHLTAPLFLAEVAQPCCRWLLERPRGLAVRFLCVLCVSAFPPAILRDWPWWTLWPGLLKVTCERVQPSRSHPSPREPAHAARQIFPRGGAEDRPGTPRICDDAQPGRNGPDRGAERRSGIRCLREAPPLPEHRFARSGLLPTSWLHGSHCQFSLSSH